MVKLKCLESKDIKDALDELARLRIEVFSEYPYLYEGDRDYEKSYLANYLDSKTAIVIIAQDGSNIVGASTGLALKEADKEFQRAFDEPLDGYFYFGESVLEMPYRNQGIGSKFMDLRLEHAKRLGFKTACFCAVERNFQPDSYRPLDAFWRKKRLY